MYSGPRPARAMSTPPLRLPMRRSLLLLPALAALALPARAADWWLLGTDPQNASSMNGASKDSNVPAGWAAAPGGAQAATSAGDPGGVYHVPDDVRLRTPPGLREDYAFPGARLVLDGSGAIVMLKMADGRTLGIGDLLVPDGGRAEFLNGDSNHTKRLAGTNWVVEAGGFLSLNVGETGARHLVCSATIRGAGTLAAAAGTGSDCVAGSATSVTLEGDLTSFAGVLSAAERGVSYSGDLANAVARLGGLVIAAPSALPQATPGDLPLPGAVVATNGAKIAFSCSATSPDARGWDFGDGAAPTVRVEDGCTVTVRGPVAGSAGLVKTGGGTLVLDAGGAGEFGRMVLAGETNVAAATLAAYAAASEALFDRFPDATQPYVAVSSVAPGFRSLRVSARVSRTGEDAATVRVLYRVAPTAAALETAPDAVAHAALAAGADASFVIRGLPAGEERFVRVYAENTLGVRTAGPVFRAVPDDVESGLPSGTATLREWRTDGFVAEATVTDFGEGATSASMRLEASADESFATLAAASPEASATLGVPAALAVSGLAPAARYHLRVRFVNGWGVESFVSLGAASTQRAVYVDSLAAPGGDGASPATAFRTLREGIADAGAHCTVWVRGGPDRSYDVTNAAEALSIPASKAHLSIRSFGGEGPARLAVAPEYTRDWLEAGNEGNVHVISNAAEHLAIEGFRFEWGAYSLGRKNYGSSSLVWTDAAFLALSDCEFVQTEGSSNTAFSGDTPIIWCYQANATNLLVEGCRFFGCRMSEGHLSRGYYLITPRGTGSVAGCVFTNCAAVVRVPLGWDNPVYGCRQLVFVSNIVFEARVAAEHGVFWARYNGPSSVEMSYNRFVNVAAPPAGVLLEKEREGWNGADGDSIHHNTIIGYRALIRASELHINGATMGASIFDNIVVLPPGSTNIVENSDTRLDDNGQTMFRPGSFFRNNALRTGAFNGGTASTLQIDGWTYDITAGLAISDVFALDAATAQSVTNVFASAGKPVPEGAVRAIDEPVFVNLSDPFHPDFARPRSRRGPGDVGYLGWRGANGEYPRHLGALPPLYPEATLLILR